MGPRHPLITVAAVQLAAILEEVFVQQRQERSDTTVSRVCNHSLNGVELASRPAFLPLERLAGGGNCILETLRKSLNAS